MKTYEFKLYRTPKERYLWRELEIANEVYNFCITAIRWQYALTKKHLSYMDLGKIITQVKKAPMYARWNDLNSQAIEDQAKRIHKAWQAFFANLKLPKSKRRRVRGEEYLRPITRRGQIRSHGHCDKTASNSIKKTTRLE